MSAVTCSVCPGFSFASLAAANFGSITYTTGSSFSAAGGIRRQRSDVPMKACPFTVCIDIAKEVQHGENPCVMLIFDSRDELIQYAKDLLHGEGYTVFERKIFCNQLYPPYR
jgi:hypothetical protein